MAADIANMLRDRHTNITTDGWAPCASDSYLSLTVLFITAGCELVTSTLNCTKCKGSTKGEDLAEAKEGMVTPHDLTGRVAACTIECEPSMVEAGRISQ